MAARRGVMLRDRLARLEALAGHDGDVHARSATARWIEEQIGPGKPPNTEEEDAWCATVFAALDAWGNERERQR